MTTLSAALLRQDVAVAGVRLAGTQRAFVMTVVQVQVVHERKQHDLARHIRQHRFETRRAGERAPQDRVQASKRKDRERPGHREKRR